MADKRLTGYVTVTDGDGTPHRFGPDDKVPSWAASKITNPAAWATDDETPATALASGVGSGRPSGSSGGNRSSSSSSSSSDKKGETVDEVLTRVGDDPEAAKAALEAETGEGGKNRSSLVSKLEAIASGGDGSGGGSGDGGTGGGSGDDAGSGDGGGDGAGS